MKKLILSIAIISVFSGCTAAQINDNADSITKDITNVFEEGKEK